MEERRHGSPLLPNLIRGGAFSILLVLSIFAGRMVVAGHPQTSPAMPEKEQTLSGSFSDIFSGTAWIDEKKTTLYRDYASGAFLYPPKFTWSSVDDGRVLTGLGDAGEKSGEERVCIGQKCLVTRDTKLFLDDGGHFFPVPYPLSEHATIVRITATALSSKWLVGITQGEGTAFSARIFYYDGAVFQDIFSDGRYAFQSPREGFLGMGGTDNEWLALWSGYEGQALRARFGGEPENISPFFGIRLMRGGFKPYIVRVASRESVDWYVWGIGEGAPRMIKLFEMLDGTIGGTVDFTPLLFDESVAKIVPDGFLIRVDKKDGASEWKEFRDEGFRLDTEGIVTSRNIKTTGGYTRAVSASPLRLFDGGGRAIFEFSKNGILWEPSVPGEETQWNSPDKELYWRARFIRGENTHLTPFFDGIHVDYREAI